MIRESRTFPFSKSILIGHQKHKIHVDDHVFSLPLQLLTNYPMNMRLHPESVMSACLCQCTLHNAQFVQYDVPVSKMALYTIQ